MIDERQVTAWFSVPEIKPEQKEAFEKVMAKAKEFAEAVNQHMPDGEDKAQVLQALRQNVLTVELAIRYRWQPLIRMAAVQ